MKLIIWIPGSLTVNGIHRGEYTWSEKHRCHIFRGKEFDPPEFNEVVEVAYRRYPTLFPLVKAIEEPPAPPAPKAPVAELDIEEPTDPENDLAKALDVVERLAPHRLKKQPGPPRASVPA